MTPVQAAALHARLTHDLIARLTATRPGNLYLCCHPHTNHSFFQALARRYGVRLQQQQGQDLGERMQRALTTALQYHRHALLVGCDCPTLTAADCQTAFAALERNADVVLGPAEDGGYVLLGLSRVVPELFQDMPWGSEHVLAETRRRIATLALRHTELPRQWDLDRPEDLERYRQLQRNTTCSRR